MRKLWGGAFDGSVNDLVDQFGQSIQDDLTFWLEDVDGSIAHARMLGEQKILAASDVEAILKGLEQIRQEGPSMLPNDVEDIHTAVEVRLHALIGEPALRLHTGRSRNDQVALDGRLHLRRRLADLAKEIKSFQAVLVSLAEKHTSDLMPGVTHQQHAQPITLGFHFLAYFWMLQRHGYRLEALLKLSGGCPLGSAALSGTPFPIDREMTARELGFDGPSPNALDATSDRSIFLDALHLSALIMVDLSRLSQEIVLWSTPEFGFVRLADAVTTGSSIMPQKRNPDMAELIRGRTGKVIGYWTALSCTMKGMVMGYNRDTQEDKPPVFESLSLAQRSLILSKIMLEGATFRTERMRAAVKGDFSTATDLADKLAEAGLAFRVAHEITGRVVRFCEARGIGLEDLTPELLRLAAPETPVGLEADILQALTPEGSVARRSSFGGTAPKEVARQATRCREVLGESGFAELS